MSFEVVEVTVEVAVEVTEGDDMEEVQGEMEVLPLTFVVLFFFNNI